MLTVSHLNEGMKFVALCTISQGTEPLRFQWFKNGFPISNHISNAKIETSSIVSNLIFEKVTRADSANYTCVVSNSFGEDSKSFTLSVKVSLKWIEEPKDSTVTEGRDFIINCNAEGIPPPQIKWKKGQNEVQRSKQTLEFKSITLGDSGEYECIAENGVDNSLRMQVTIFCSVFQGTEPLEFNWYKDGNSLNKRLSNGKIDINLRASTLTFDKITRIDSGNYTCVVKNVYGENKTSFALTVNVAMKWIEKPKDTTIILGHNHIITCIADGFPRPQISWRKNKNVILSHSERFEIKNADYKDRGEYECKAENGVDQILSKTFKITIVGGSTLIFEKVSRNDSGNYTCVVNNAYGEDKTSFVLTIKVAMKWIEEPKDMTIVEGNGIIINCIAEGFPRPQISWWKNKNVILSHSERFEIKNADYKDKGEYECKAENGVDQILSKKFKIIVVDQPHIQPMFTTQTVGEGVTYTALCSVSKGAKPLHFQWLKDGMPLQSDSENLKIETSSIISNLIFEKVNRADSGNYTCIVTNSLGRDSKSFVLTVKVSLKWLQKPKDEIVLLGNDVEIECLAEGLPLPQIKWKKAQTYLPVSSKILKVVKANLEDDGEYECIADNGADNALSEKFRISVVVCFEISLSSIAPKLIPLPSLNPINEERPFALFCIVEDGSLPLSFQWFKNYKLINEQTESVKIESFKSSSNLRIEQLKQDHSGNYTCTVSNAFGTDSQTVNLIVKAPVKWLKEPEDIHVAMNSEITIECMAAGAPQPKIIWKRNKEVFPTVNGKFHINRVTLSDSGVYDCIADNGIDAPLMKSITIHVNGTSPIFFEWSKDGQPIKENKIIIKTEETISTLTINEVSRFDGGNYTCVARNAYGKDAHFIRLTIKIPMTWKTEPQDTTVVEAQSLELVCVADGNPEPKITWIKKEPEIFINEGSYLRIERVKTSDEGHFECIADNGVEKPLRKIVKVVVVDAPKISKTLITSSFSEGSTFLSTCAIQQGTPPFQFQWLKNDAIPIVEGKNVNIETNDILSILRINNVSLSDAGNYTCIAKNAFGKDTQIVSLIVKDKIIQNNVEKLTIKGLPENSGKFECVADNGVDTPLRKSVEVVINATSLLKMGFNVVFLLMLNVAFCSHAPKLIPLPSFASIKEGSSFKLLCSVSEGSDPLHFKWSKDGKTLFEINIETNERDSTLKINEIKQSESGNYTCEVSNSFGKDIQVINLVVKAPLKWQKEPKDVQLLLDENEIIECSVTGFPSPTIIWKRNGNK
ncbi:titin-like protein [Dinothrombium tinctorium]|uniref:Titin-like protein n=1 Tax=Dinothrombium tinctorium TaxID=1965070 RepID=A0A3S3P4J9_9ACAR|nr:titin-like protein [Dinothrombium tinctorium]